MFVKKCAVLGALSLMLLPAPVFSQSEALSPDIDCLNCHGSSDIHQIQTDGRLRSLFVNPDLWSEDVHKISGMFCVDCHINANPVVHFREGFPQVDCSRCHSEEKEEYTRNIHFEYRAIAEDRKLPECQDCHTKHSVLLHDNSSSSIHESNIGKTCGQCHAEVMVKGILKGSSLGKISGHRKGDLSEEFDMNVCISCHYNDSAHGQKRAHKDFCTRCHNPSRKGNAILGATHTESFRWSGLNLLGSGLSFLLLLGLGVYYVFRSRQKFYAGVQTWFHKMRLAAEPVKDSDADSRQASTAVHGAKTDGQSGVTPEEEK